MHFSGEKKIFMLKVDLGARNNPLKFPPSKPCASSSAARFSPENQFFAYISINMNPRGKLQETPNIPHKISCMVVYLKVSLGLLIRRKTSLEFTNFIIFAYILEEKTCRRNFRTIKFVHHLISH